MSKFRLFALIGVSALISIFFYGLVVSSQSPQPSVRLVAKPPVSQIVPFEAEATAPQSLVLLTLQAVDAKGQPLENAHIHLKILTPPKNPWFSTDFPIVEGTELLEIEANAPKGELQFQQLLPIRGNYRFLVNVAPRVVNQFTPFQRTLKLSVPENPVKYRYFGVLIGALLVVGLVGGLVIGGRQLIQVGEIAPYRVRLLLSGVTMVAIATLLIVNISAEFAESHTHAHHSEIAHRAEDTPAVKWLGDEQATVGQLAEMGVQSLDPKTGQTATDVVMKVKATQLEDNQPVFAYQGVPDANGKLTWKQQFFDGATHKVEIEVSPQSGAAHQFPSFQVSREIEVEAVAPPVYVRLISLTYFTAIVVLGLLLGMNYRRNHVRRVGYLVKVVR